MCFLCIIFNLFILCFFVVVFLGVVGIFVLVVVFIYSLGVWFGLVDFFIVFCGMLFSIVMLVLLVVGVWVMFSNELKLIVWLIGFFMLVVFSFEVCSFFYFINLNSIVGYDYFSGLFVMVNVILVLVVSLIMCGLVYKLKNMVEKENIFVLDNYCWLW